MRTQLLTIFFLVDASFAKIKYNGFQVLRTAVPNEEQKKSLESLMAQNEFDFWSFPSAHIPAEIMSSPQNMDKLTNFLREIGLQFDVKVSDVQELIDASKVGFRRAKNESAPYELTWDQYYESDVILDYLGYLAKNYNFVETEKLASTYEGRDIIAFKILKGGKDKKNVFIDGTAHSREWISPAVVTFLLRELVENHEKNAKYTDNLNFYIVPLMNPDGYDFSHRVDRLWRKTRTEKYSQSCPGVDPNRNFPLGFGGAGSSGDHCTCTFRGPEAFSEPESAAIAKLFSSIEPVPELAISYHSALNAFLYPFANDFDSFPDNKDEVVKLCWEAVEALNAVHGQKFKCMKASDLYEAGGCTMDWYSSQGSRFVYTPELRDNGYKFTLPPEFIEPSGEENWAALKVMMNKLLE